MAEWHDFKWEGISYPVAYTRALFNFLKSKQPKYGLEVGFDQGASALCFLRAVPEGRLTSVEIDLTRRNNGDTILRMNNADLSRLSVVMGDSRNILPMMGEMFDYIYIDGDHLYDAVKQDLYNAVKLLAEGGSMIVDDATPGHAHFGVHQAVQEFLKDYPDFHARELFGSSSNALIIEKYGQ